MIYCEDSGRIIVSVKQFVNIARRCIGGSLSTDENEPLDTPYCSNIEECTLRIGFESHGHLFTLEGAPSDIKDERISINFVVEGHPNRPTKTEVSQARAEAFVLGKMYCELSGLDRIEITVRYCSKDGMEQNPVSEWQSASKLNSFFNKCAVSVGIYAEPEIDRVKNRLPTLKNLKFPFSEKREGQLDFIKSVYKNISRGNTLYACAPTGTGKTVSVLFPALRALGEGRFEKIFYLTPKGTTAEAVRACIELFSSNGAKIKSLIISAKEKCCKNGLACRDGHSLCPNSQCKKRRL